MSCTRAELEAELASLNDLIQKAEDRLKADLTGGHMTYTFDTGQNRQSVTRINLTELRRALQQWKRDRDSIRAQLNHCGAHVMRPAF